MAGFLMKKAPVPSAFCSYLAGKEGQISSQFKEDLFQIIDFLQKNKREMRTVLAD